LRISNRAVYDSEFPARSVASILRGSREIVRQDQVHDGQENSLRRAGTLGHPQPHGVLLDAQLRAKRFRTSGDVYGAGKEASLKFDHGPSHARNRRA
jgi:hypothetical protein